LLSRFRYRIDTVFSQLTERYSVKRVWARDLRHLASRLLCKVLSHTVAFLLNRSRKFAVASSAVYRLCLRLETLQTLVGDVADG
jgi:hypothetical protein